MRKPVAAVIDWVRVLMLAHLCTLGCISVTYAQNDTPSAINDTMTVNPRWCRSGAFLDAMIIMNSSMRAHGALNVVDASASRVASAELGAILNIALKQAVAEYHCIEGKLPLSYAQNYGDTLRRGITTAKQIRVAPATLESANALLAQLDYTAERQRIQ